MTKTPRHPLLRALICVAFVACLPVLVSAGCDADDPQPPADCDDGAHCLCEVEWQCGGVPIT